MFPYQGTFELPVLSFVYSVGSTLINEPRILSLTHGAQNEIVFILENQFVVSIIGGYQKFHFCWRNPPYIDNSWIIEEVLFYRSFFL